MHLYSTLSISNVLLCFATLCSHVLLAELLLKHAKNKIFTYKILNKIKYLHIIQQAAGKLCALAISVQSFSKLSFPVVL